MMNDVMMQYFEWNLEAEDDLWKKIQINAPKLQAIGIDALWLPPAYKGIYGDKDAGYGVYDLYDLGEFDQKGSVRTKYGTKDEYLKAIDVLHEHHIAVYGDIVLNHKMGADGVEEVTVFEVNKNNRNEKIGQEEKIKANTLFMFEGRHGKYSSFQWNHHHFDGVDYDVSTNRSGDFLFKGKNWDKDVDDENGNFDYLMGTDLDLNNEEVIAELKHWGMWYFDFTHIDGVRLDAIKHMSSTFYKNWLSDLRKQRNQQFFAVGEYWNGSIDKLSRYLADVDYSMSLFDVPLHFHFCDASRSQGKYDMRTIFDGTLAQMHPQNAVTFVDNHDTQIGQSLQSWIEDWFKPIAYALILLREAGYPCIFYGDYYGLKGYEYKGIAQDLERLLYLRKQWAYGQQTDYFDKSDVIGWTREKGLAVLISIGNADIKKMYVGQKYAGMIFYDYMENILEDVKIDEEGFGLFKVNGGSLSVYVLKEGEV